MEVLRWKNFCENGSLFHAGHLKTESLSSLPIHSHEFCELLFVENKTGVQDMNGKEQILTEGSLSLLYPLKDIHGIKDFDQGFSVIWIYFHRNILTGLENRYLNEKIGKTIRDKKINLLHLGPGEIEWFEKTFENLKRNENSLFEIERFLMNLFALISRYTDQTTEIVKKIPSWLRDSLESYNTPELYRRGVKGFLELTDRGMEYVNRELRRYLGKTTTQVINEIRLKHGAILLASTDRTILDICYDCGYGSPSHFYKLFNETYGTSPGEYREESRKKVLYA